MKIMKVQDDDLQTILELQYLAYQSEAKLLNNDEIPPLKQTISEIRQEYARGVILKAIDSNGEIIGSVRAYRNCDTVRQHYGLFFLIKSGPYERKVEFCGNGLSYKKVPNKLKSVRYFLVETRRIELPKASN